MRSPSPEFIERRAKILSPLRKRIFHSRWHFLVNRSCNESVPLEFSQLLCEHLLSNFGYRTFQCRETHDWSGIEIEKDAQLPTALDRLQRIFGSA